MTYNIPKALVELEHSQNQKLKKYGYDQYEEHKADHERLLDEICDITEEFENSSKLNDQKFKKNLNDWFQVHFKTYDSRLHRLANLMEHDKVDKSTLKGIMKNAKNLFFRKTG